METKLVHDIEVREQALLRKAVTGRLQSAGLRNAFRLSAVMAILMVVASVAGLMIDDLYTDGPWAREALRGGDLTTLAVAVPLLLTSLVLAKRGSYAAQGVWLGTLAYSVYNYAYLVFGAEFNDIFVLHIATFSISIITLVLAVASVQLEAIAARFREARGARWIVRMPRPRGSGTRRALGVPGDPVSPITGELMADIPTEGIHLVFAIDTSLLVPALVGSASCCGDAPSEVWCSDQRWCSWARSTR